MANVTLTGADLALFSDPVGTRVAIPFLTAFAPQVRPAVAFRHFEGQTYPTAFRGTTLSRTLTLTCTFPPDDHAAGLALVELLESAYLDAADGRLQLRTNAGKVAGLDPLEVILPTSWSDVPQSSPGLFRIITVEATRVEYALGV